MTNSDLAGKIIGCAMKVHTELGPGLLESVYQTCLLYELKKLGLKAESEKRISIKYDGIELNGGHRIDLVVENDIIVELKTVENLTDLHLAQILTYLRLSNIKIGLLINFNCVHLKQGLRRVINKHYKP